jgi:hypothetical protein
MFRHRSPQREMFIPALPRPIFLYKTDAALLAWDWQDTPRADQGIPSPLPGIDVALRVHHIAIPYMGMPLIDNADLEQLAQAGAELGRYEFHSSSCARRSCSSGGTGSPVNPPRHPLSHLTGRSDRTGNAEGPSLAEGP